MYASYLPQQMGLRQAGIPRKRETDNYYIVLAKARVRRLTAGPVTRRDATGKVVETRPNPVAVVAKQARERKAKKALDKSARIWYDCKCGRQTRRSDGKCEHAGVAFAGIDNSGKDHL